MNYKFRTGNVVRIKKTGEKAIIREIVGFTHVPAYWIDTDKKQGVYVFENEIKPYCPSRTGKYRNAKGQFTQYEKVICSWCDKWFGDIGKHLMTCPMRKAAQEQREQFSWTDVSDSKQRNYQKIELVRIKDGNGSQVDKNFEFLAKRLNQVIEKINKL